MLGVVLQLRLQEAEAGVLQVVDAQEVCAQDDLPDVLPAQHQLGRVGELEQRRKALRRHLGGQSRDAQTTLEIYKM